MHRRQLLAVAVSAGALASGSAASAAGRPKTGSSWPIVAKDGTGLFVREWGRGGAVVFTHSLALSSEIWFRQMIYLAEAGFRCIAYDRRGHGRSDVPATGYDLDTLADDLACVIESVDEREVVLVGHSMGAGEILRYVARHGTTRVSKIALLAPTTPCLLAAVDNPTGIPRAGLEKLSGQWTADFPKWVEDNKRPFFAPETSAAMMDWLSGLMLETYLPVVLACNRAMIEADHRPGLTSIDKPVLIIHGDKDVSAPLDLTGRPTAAGIPSAKLEIYAGAPHGLFVTHADRVNADLRLFMASTPNDGRSESDGSRANAKRNKRSL